MADRVHPTDNSNSTSVPSEPEKSDLAPRSPVPSFAPRPQPAPGTYVVQLPKDQIYRVPPPENSRRYENLVKNKNHRHGRCCRCCCCVFFTLIALLIALGILAAVFYIMVRPKSPRYSVPAVSVKGMNISASTFSPNINVNVRAENPNRLLRIYYEKKSSVVVSYRGTPLCSGSFPSFSQGSKNVSVFTIPLSGKNVRLSDADHELLREQAVKHAIPLQLDLTVPVRIKVWGIKSWRVDVKLRCALTLNQLAQDAKTVSRKCRVKVNPWWW